MKLVRCRDCGAGNLVWAKSPNGKNMLMETEPDDKGTWGLTENEDNGDVTAGPTTSSDLVVFCHWDKCGKKKPSAPPGRNMERTYKPAPGTIYVVAHVDGRRFHGNLELMEADRPEDSGPDL